jgi:hypothetical protein
MQECWVSYETKQWALIPSEREYYLGYGEVYCLQIGFENHGLLLYLQEDWFFFFVSDIVVLGCSSLWDGLFSFSQNVLQIFTCTTVRGSA